MLNFPEDFKNAETVILNINYRCSGNILDTAMKVINYNENRYAKKLSTPNEPGEPVQIKEFRNPRDEYMAVASLLRNRMEEGDNIEDTALLFRTNQETEGLVAALMEYGVPFTMKEKLPNLVPTLDLPEYDRLFENGRRRPEPQYISGDHEPPKPIHSQRCSDRKKR